ncbi:MAG: Ig-like domain-containing protein [Paracoccaceae bacterium]
MDNYAGVTLVGATGEAFGANAVIIGDVNGDGFADMAASAPRADYYNGYFNEGGGYNSGAVYVVFGGPDLPASIDVTTLDGTNGFKLLPDLGLRNYYFGGRYSSFGDSIAAVGDVNGDGVDDFAVTQASSYVNYGYYGGSAQSQGVAYVILGGQDWEGTELVNDAAGFRIDTEGLINSVVGLGDVNGDGFDEVGVNAVDVRTGNFEYVDFYYLRDLNGNGVYDALADDGSGAASGESYYTSTLTLERGRASGFVIFGTDEDRVSDDPIAQGGGGGPISVTLNVVTVPEDAPTTSETIVNTTQLADGDGFEVVTGELLTQNFSGNGYAYSFLGQSYAAGSLIAAGDVNGDGFADLAARDLSAFSEVFDVAPGETPSVRVVVDGNTGNLVSVTPANPEIGIASAGDFIILGRDDATTAFPTTIDPFDPEVDFQGAPINDPGGIAANVGDVSGNDGFDDIAYSDILFSNTADNPDNFDIGGVRIQSGTTGDPFAAPVTNFITDTSNTVVDGINEPEVVGFQLGFADEPIGPGPIGGAGQIQSLGDVSGDGIDDFLVLSAASGILIEGPGPVGVVGNLDSVRPGAPIGYVIFGQADPITGFVDIADTLGEGFTADERVAFKVVGLEESFGSFGISASGLGDVDGDGTNDVIFGASGRFVPVIDDFPQPGGTGGARVLFGGLSNLDLVDAADGTSDGYIDIRNIGLGIELSISGAGFVSEFESEGDSGATPFEFQVFRTGDLTVPVSFDFEVTPTGFNQADADDFVGGVFPTGTVDFDAGSNVATVTVDVQGDFEIESSEDFAVTISNGVADDGTNVIVVGGSTSARIFNDDQPVRVFARNSSSVEGNPGEDNELVMFIDRFGNDDVEITVDFTISASTADADDFEAGAFGAASGQQTFAAGQTRAEIRIAIDEDFDIEANEQVRLTINSAVLSGADAGGATSVIISDGLGFGTITNDDFPPQIGVLAVGSTNRAEGTSPDPQSFTEFTFEIVRQGDTDGVTDVTFELNPLPSPGNFFAADSNDIAGIEIDGVEVPGTGVLPLFGQTVTFEDGEFSKLVTVNVVQDSIIEPRESFELRITEVDTANGVSYNVFRPSASATIRNDDGRPPIIPPGVEADVFGDPHIVTLDGLGYDFQAVGEYVLVESTIDNDPRDFQVQVRFEPLPGSDLVSVTTRMAVDVAGVRIEIDALGSDPLLIDGVGSNEALLATGALDVNGDGTFDIFFDADLDAYFIVLNDLNEQLQIKNMDGVLNICVFLSNEAGGHANNVQGLMGNANGDTTDDLTLRDGSVTFTDPTFEELYVTYADSWAVTANERNFSDPEGSGDFPAGFPAAKISIDDLPASVLAAAEAAVDAAGITDPIIRESAILDFALTGDGDFIQGALGLAADPIEEVEVVDAPALPLTIGVTPSETVINEGDGNPNTVSFTFFRIGDGAEAVTIDYAIGGEVDAADLTPGTALTGQVTIPANAEATTLSIGVVNDSLTELDEALVVTITGNDSGALVASASATTVIETDDFAPVATDDRFSTDEDTQILGNLLSEDNGDGLDDDPDGDALSVVSITDTNGDVRDADGGLIILESGAHLRVNSDGSFSFDPFGFAIGGGSANDSDFDQLGAGEVGEQNFTYTISDGNGGEDSADVVIGVTGSNDAPVAVVDGLNLTEDDASASLNLVEGSISPDVDPEGGALIVTEISVGGETFVIDPNAPTEITLNGGGRLTIDSEGNATFFTDGAFEALGEDSSIGQVVQSNINFTYTIEDEGGLTDTALFQVFVGGVNDGPVAAEDTFTTDFGQVLDISAADLLNNDFDAEGDELVVVLGDSAPVGGTVELTQSGSVTFTPAEGFNGATSFTYFAVDPLGAQSEETTVFVTVNDRINNAPEVTSDAFLIDEDNPVTGNLLLDDNGNGIDFDFDGDTLFIANVTDAGGTELDLINGNALTGGGVVAIGPDGAFFFDPDGDFEELAENQSEVISLTVGVSDGLAIVDSSLEITVTGVNDAPTAETITADFTEDDPIELDRTLFLSGIEDVDNDIGDLSVVAVDFGDNLDGDFDPDTETLTLANEQFQSLGSDDESVFDIVYTVSDGGEEVLNTVTVTISGVNDTPTVETITAEFTEDDPIELDRDLLLSGIDDVDNSVGDLTVLGVDFGDNLDGDFDPDTQTLTLSNEQFQGLNVVGSNVFEVTYTVTDGALDDTGALVEVLNTATITVTGLNDAPEIISDADLSVTENTPFQAQIVTEDVDDAPEDVALEISGGADAALFELSPDGVLTFVNDPDFEAPLDDGEDNVYDVQVTATNPDGAATSQDITVSVLNDPSDDEPGGDNVVSGTAGVDFLQGTAGDDVFRPGAGFVDLIDLRAGGSDTIEFFGETDNGVREVDYVLGFGSDDFLDLGGASIDNELNFFGRTYLFLEGDNDVIVLFGVQGFDEAQLV